jgi:hypothetical protein
VPPDDADWTSASPGARGVPLVLCRGFDLVEGGAAA